MKHKINNFKDVTTKVPKKDIKKVLHSLISVFYELEKIYEIPNIEVNIENVCWEDGASGDTPKILFDIDVHSPIQKEVTKTNIAQNLEVLH